MKISKIVLLLVILILTLPLFSIISLSFQNTNGNFYRWYEEILADNFFLEALGLSFIIAFIVGLLSVLLSFFLSLTWYDNKQRLYTFTTVVLIGLLPPDILAQSISFIAQKLHLYNSNLFFLILCLVLYSLPFGILIFWTRYYFIDDIIIKSSRDLGMNKLTITTKILLPLSSSAAISTFLLCFLLSLNEYPRTFYLSGAYVFLSEYLNGKLSSGTNSSIYAGGSLTIILAIVVILIYLVYNWFTHSMKSTSESK